MSRRKLRVGMVGGGGPANFFGAPHRRAILMDNAAELTAGALRSKPEESIESAKELFFARGYGDWRLDDEGRGRPAGLGADRLRHHRHARTTPTTGRPTRRPRAGIGVLCEKPLTTTLDEAKRLLEVVEQGDQVAVRRRLHIYRLPMVMFAKDARQGRRHRRGPQGRGLVSARLAGHEPRGRRPEAGRLAGRPGQGGRLGLRRRHRHPRLRVRPVRRRDSRRPSFQRQAHHLRQGAGAR